MKANKILRLRNTKHLFEILIVLLTAILMFSSVMLWRDFSDMKKSEDDFAALEKIAEITVSSSDEPSNKSSRNISALTKKNGDCVGWISIPDTAVNYPVMHTPRQPQKYLRRNFYGEYSYAGVPFVDARCNLNSTNLMIYGHCMKNGTMFRAIRKYSGKNFWKTHPYIEFETVDGCGVYDVFAIVETTTSCDWYNFINADSREEFDRAVKSIKSKSIYDTGITPKYGDCLLTLSTCYGSSKDGRFLVIAMMEAKEFATV